MRDKTPKDYPMGRHEKIMYRQTSIATIVLAVVVGYLIGKWLFS